jgi:uncharacterized protein YlaN (UPF0358 family)
MNDLQENVIELLDQDINKLFDLMDNQMNELKNQQSSRYEEIMDTQLFGFSCVVDFLIRLGLLNIKEGMGLLFQLQNQVQKRA